MPKIPKYFSYRPLYMYALIRKWSIRAAHAFYSYLSVKRTQLNTWSCKLSVTYLPVVYEMSQCKPKVNLRWLYTIFWVFAGSDIYFSWCSSSFSPVKISGSKHSFEYLSPYALLKAPLQLVNPVSMVTSGWFIFWFLYFQLVSKRVCPNFAR